MPQQHFYIKCNVSRMEYLYWSGVAWTKDLHRAMKFDSARQGEKELATLSPPRFYDRKGPGPEVFAF